VRDFDPGYDRTGSGADITGRLANVCFTPQSGHRATRLACPPCAKSGHSIHTAPCLLSANILTAKATDSAVTRSVWVAPSRPKPGDCCGFCSNGSVQCPPIQNVPPAHFSDTPKRGFSCALRPCLSHCRARLRTAHRARAMP